MKKPLFHHPDISLTVLRRSVAAELVEMAGAYATFLATRGRSMGWEHAFTNRNSYYAASYRLRKQGLAMRLSTDLRPILTLSDQGRERLPDYHRPERFWRRRWNGIWYVLMYDVPESARKNRDVLRRFFRRHRMGCYQRSVWITPSDIRPLYADLTEAAGLGDYAVLFEGQTVLGQSPDEIVRQAWDFERLGSVQAWYCGECRHQLERLAKGQVGPAEAQQLAREEMGAFGVAMAEDPLLPRALHPRNYDGVEVYGLHRRMVKELAALL